MATTPPATPAIKPMLTVLLELLGNDVAEAVGCGVGVGESASSFSYNHTNKQPLHITNTQHTGT